MQNLEIEVKFYLADLEGMRNKILKLGAKSKGRLFENNIRYEDKNNSLIKKKSLQTALKAINNKWVGNEFKEGESEDPYFKLCFRNMNPIDDDFQKLAEKVFSPILAHCVEITE